MMSRAFAPLVASAIGLAGALASTLALHHAAATAMDRVLDERLRGAGESAAALFGASPDPESLRAVMRANGLDGAYIVGPRFRVVADASGPSGRRADLLRLDVDRFRQALAGVAVVTPGYELGSLTVMTGYFPIRQAGLPIARVLVLEAGRSFVAAYGPIARARLVGLALSALSALGLAIAAARWNRAERQRRDAVARAARGEMLTRVAVMAAHEIRNPLCVIRGTVDLMRERSAATLTDRDRLALGDVLGEVERLRRLTQDLVDLAEDKPLTTTDTSIADLLEEAARGAEVAFTGIRVYTDLAPLPALAVDPARLRQAFANLLTNAAQAMPEGEIHIKATCDGRAIHVMVSDQGPSIPDEISDRLFDLHFTTRTGGTGLGLAMARRFVERHGGTVVHRRDLEPGTAFEVTLPVRAASPETADGG